MVMMATMERMEAVARMEVSCVPLSPTSRALSAPPVCPETRALQDKRAHEDQREPQERTERTATRERTVCRDQSVCRDLKGRQDHQDQREPQDESSKSTGQPDLRDHQDHQGHQARRELLAATEPTPVDPQALRATTALQDLREHQALRDLQAPLVKPESQAAASTALLHEHHLVTKLLASLIHLCLFSKRQR